MVEASNGDKHLFCYCHFGGDLVENEDNPSMHYKGGKTVGITITSTTTFDEFILQIQRRLGLSSSNLRLKYALEFDKTQLIDLLSEEDMHEMVNISAKFANVYVFSTEEASENLDHQETHPTQFTAMHTRGARVLGHNNVHSSSDAPTLLDNSNLATSCIDAEQRVLDSDLWKNEIYGTGQTFNNAVTLRQALYRYSIAHKFGYIFCQKQPTYHTCSLFSGWMPMAHECQSSWTDRLLEGGDFYKGAFSFSPRCT